MSQRQWLQAALALLLCTGSTLFAEPGKLSVEEQNKVNQAIDQGIGFLKASQTRLGTWATTKKHVTGYTALPGLVLLECGVPPNDPSVQMAARVVRQLAPTLDGTYELALGILFLDRLGNRRDRPLIHTMAARLIAGQAATGGWGYKCPRLNRLQEGRLLSVLLQLERIERPEGIPVRRNPDQVALGKERPGVDLPGVKEGGAPGKDLANLPEPGEIPLGSLPDPEETSPGNEPKDLVPSTLAPGGDPLEKALLEEQQLAEIMAKYSLPRPGFCIRSSSEVGQSTTMVKEDPVPEEKPKVAPPKPARVVIPPAFRGLPVFIPIEGLPLIESTVKGATINGRTDNSNTQFALLALWTARRHDVPVHRSLNLLIRRYQTSQNKDGSWAYLYAFGGSDQRRPAMTCVGLLGLAVGHGIALNRAQAGAMLARDPLLLNGMIALSRWIGNPLGRMNNLPQSNLYFLWSIERVGVLYNLKEIGGKDWYRWGAEQLVANQQAQGHWTNGGYPGASPVIDTCLALLFLKRANFLRDLDIVAEDLPQNVNAQLAALTKPRTEEPKKSYRQEPPLEKPGQTPSTPELATLPEPALSPKMFGEEGATSTGLQQTESEPTEGASEKSSGKSGKLFLLLIPVLALLGVGAVLIYVGKNRGEVDEEEEERPRKKRSRSRR